MLARIALSCLIAGMLYGSASSESLEPRLIPSRGRDVIHGGNTDYAKAVVDTIDLMGPAGSAAPYVGDFESGWQGWTSLDRTAVTENHWQVGSFLQPDLTTDMEPGYECVYLSVNDGVEHRWTNIAFWSPPAVHEPYQHQVDELFIVTPEQYLLGGEIRLLFRFRSDGAFSGADCLYPSDYACRLDNVDVTISQTGQPVLTSLTDFQDDTFGAGAPAYPPGVGDFAKIWIGLRDIDPCAENPGAQVAFIDDGLVVPGTGGSG